MNTTAIQYLHDYEATKGFGPTFLSFEYNHHAYMVRLDRLDILEEDVKLEMNSKGRMALRLKLHSKTKSKLLGNAQKLESNPSTVFECLKGQNEGDCFEAYFLKRFKGQPLEVWKHDSHAYYERGDAEMFGEQVSLKTGNATFAEVATIDKAMGR